MRFQHTTLWMLAATIGSAVPPVTSAMAETDRVRIVGTPGLAQFPARLAVERALIEKHVKAQGLPEIKVTYQQVTSGNVVSDLILSGNADVGVGGNVPLFTLWDKTRGSQKVRGIMPFSQGHMFLISSDERIKSLADYTDKDRIAMTGVRSTTYSMLLQMGAAKAFGWEGRAKLDNITVGMGNDDAMLAMLSGKHEVKSHMTIMPHSTMELASGKARVVMNSKDLLGGPYTLIVSFGTEKFKAENPKVYAGVVAALEESIGLFSKQPRETAELYKKLEPVKNTVDELVAMIEGKTPDELQFTSTPKSTQHFTEFMVKSGTLKNQPQSWKDVWFENVWTKPGN